MAAMTRTALFTLLYCCGAALCAEWVIYGEHRKPGSLLHGIEPRQWHGALWVAAVVIAATWWLVIPVSVARLWKLSKRRR
jgi:hypothetical protein